MEGWTLSRPLEIGVGKSYNENWADGAVVTLTTVQDAIEQIVDIECPGNYLFLVDYGCRDKYCSEGALTAYLNGDKLPDIYTSDTDQHTEKY